MNIAIMSHTKKQELMVQFCTAYCGSEFILGWHPTDWDAPYKTSHEFTLTSGDILTFKFTAIMEADCEYTVTITEVTI